MTRSVEFASLLILFAGAAVCQSGAQKPSFDAVDVHVSPPRTGAEDAGRQMQGGFLNGDRYEIHKATMLDLIRTAYNVDAGVVFGGPSWLDYDRFEIDAQTKPGTRPEALRLMLQTLLAERFHLAVKPDTRPTPGYVLSKGAKELKLRAAAEGSNSAGCGNRFQLGDGAPHSSMECRNVTMDSFAATVQRLLSTPARDVPVLNSTGLEGGWDVEFDMPVRQVGSNAPADAGIIDTMDKLGLKLEAGSVPRQVLVVESVDEKPTPNAPDVAARLPPLPPPQFEVAAIEWPCHANYTGSERFEAGGRVTAVCVPLISLIRRAWNLPMFAEPAGAPKWLTDGNSTKYNISIAAKAPAGLAVDPQRNAEARDVLSTMLRSLLTERYNMKVHYEDRPMDAGTLVAVKPKLTKADPANRTGCSRQNLQQQGQGQGRVAMAQLVCRNMTMAQFAELIPAYAIEMSYPVLDATGMEGAWDFTVNWDAMASLYARYPQFSGAAVAPASGEASEPSGSLTFAEAIERQLGLKLKMEKRPEPVLVIDHIDEKPAEN
jgi:uncharacterized protein (TIGR03435 family)